MATPDTGRAGVLDRLAGLIVAVERPHPIRVAIDGRTAAGKTTLADELAAPIERLGRPAIRVSVDDFHRPLAERRRRQELPPPDRYYLDSFDYPAIRATLLLPLGPGGNRRYCRARFDSFHDVPFDEPERVAPADAVILVDGVFLFRPELNELWDFRIFVEIDADESYRRGPPRDRAWMGSLERAAERYRTIYLPGEQHYLDTIRPWEHADVVLDNLDPAVPRIVRR